MKKIKLTLLGIFIGIFSLSAQEYNPGSAIKNKNMAESAELEGDLYSAIYYYANYLSQKPNDKKVQLKLASLYMDAHEFVKANAIYTSLLNGHKNKNEVLYQLALSYKYLGMYDSCLVYLDRCNKKKLPVDLKVKYPIEYNGAKMGKNEPTEDNVIHIYHLDSSINKPHMEYSPSYIDDSTIFYSSFENTVNNAISKTTGKIYKANLMDSLWVRSTSLPFLSSANDTYYGNGCFSLDKKRYYFSQCFRNWQNKTICQLYFAQVKNGQIEQPTKIESEINDLFFTSSQPTVGVTYNPDLEIIYYVSDRPGGLGGSDIWYTVYNIKRMTFSTPTNAGSKINTPWNEATPYYNVNTKTLYFSTDGHESYGGYDIYKSTGELKSWFKPKNIGNYINSNADELSYILNSRQNAGFFVSNRKGSFTFYNEYCCYDLYYFKFNNPKLLDLRGKLLVSLNPQVEKLLQMGIEFRDSVKTRKSVDQAVVALYLKDNYSSDSLFIGTDTTDQDGNYGFKVDRNQDYSLIIRDQNEEIKGKIDVCTSDSLMKENTNIVLASKEIETLPEVPLIIKNINYEFGKSELSNQSKKRLDSTLVFILKEIPDVRIEISSYTDDIGDETYNKKLSEQRAKNVMLYLTEKGIDSKRMETKGYGEESPIAPNKNPDGSDNPSGREKNRRTEFKILGKHTQQSHKF